MKFLKIKYLSRHGMIQKKIEINDISINEIFVIQHNQLLLRVEGWMYEVSDWATNSEIQHQLTFLEIVPYEGSYYISLIKGLRNQIKELINIQNKVNECFI